MRYLLDTNTVSFAARERSPTLRVKLANAAQHGSLCISAVTEAELLYGIARIAPAPRLERIVVGILDQLTILPWTSTAARTYATFRATLERSGRTVAALDLLIAAHALAEDCTLITNDAALLRLGDHLRIEDWS